MTGRTSRHWQSCYLGRWAMIDLSHIAEGLRGLAVEVGSLHADPANARKGHAVERIAASLRQYGQRKPIVVNRLQGNKVEAGNGTLSAARLLGWSHVAAVFVEDDAATATGFGIADNRTGDLSEWDLEALDSLLGSIDPDEIFTGFEAGELDDLLEEAGKGKKGDGQDAEPQIDRAEELREKWGVEPGQLWRLPSRTPGQEHRLICGDCTDAAVVERVNDGRANALIFDPEWDDMPDAIRGYSSVLAFCDGGRIGDVITRYGPPTWVFVWDCVSSWYTPNRPLRRMKLCAWYGDIDRYHFDGWHYGDAGEMRDVWNTRGGYKFVPDPRGKHLSDVFPFPITRLHKESEHNHSKPIDWITLLIGNCTTGDIYDPFLGSGTTLIAAENLSRQCRACEISAPYVSVALQRYLDAFGIRAELVE